jgi:glutamate racemase
VSVISAACPQFVDFVERGVTTGHTLLDVATGYLEPLRRLQVDTLVLGCTHYPLLAGVISLVMGEQVTLVSSADETARDVYRVLAAGQLARADDAPSSVHRFIATGDPAMFRRLAQRFLGADLLATAVGASP